MTTYILLITVVVLSISGFLIGRYRASAMCEAPGASVKLHSRPSYYGLLTAMWCGVPALIVAVLWHGLEPAIIDHLVLSDLPPEIRSLPENRLSLVLNDIKNQAAGVMFSESRDPVIREAADHCVRLRAISRMAMSVVILSLSIIALVAVQKRLSPEMRARNHVERFIRCVLVVCSTLAIFTTVGIVLSILFEAMRFFKAVPVTEFLFGLKWSPQMAIRADQVGASGAFGAVPVFVGTMLVSAIAMFVAVPIGLMSAIYLSEYAGSAVRTVAKPVLELLAGIPTVVYGFFAALTVAPFIRDMGTMAGLDVSSESALAAGLVMGIMIIPFVSSLSDDVINAVPQDMRDGSYGLGATKSETIKYVVIPAALPGIVGGILLAISRAIGETMIVVMAAGLSANLTVNPLKAVTTVTVQIVTLLVGDQEFDSPKTLAAFALALLLFIVTLLLNIIALYIVRRYREQYE
ncbi:MAG TPA: phosphate ABC transporter permease subunit PstC [Thermodesulfobacteriaceae bacterium]|nr:phosphate ABC transporter permease subunit PstC [Thermodesulfobacteriaceae bacterium]